MTDTHTILANPARSASIAAAAASTASSDQQQPLRSAASHSHSDMQTSAMGSHNGKIPDGATPKMPYSSSSSSRPFSVRDNGDSSVDGDGESCSNASPLTTTTTIEQQPRYDQSAELEADPSILEALKGKDRLYVLKLGEQMEALIRDRRPRVDLAPATSYHRLLVHRCCAYYKLVPEPDPTTKSISALLTPESAIPVRKIKDLVPQEAPAQPTFKIMRRSPSQRQRHKTRSQSGSTAGEDGDLSDVEPSETSSVGGRSSAGRKQMTIEEREAAYKEARSRIFMDFATKEREKEKDMSAGSSTFSLLSGSASTSNAGSVGDFDDLGSSPTTESEWSCPVTRERFDGRNRGSRNHSSNSSQRSLRSNGPPFNSSNGSSSRNSRTASPSVHYASLYEAPPAAPYDHHTMQPYPTQYYYPYPPPPPNQVAPQSYMMPYPYYPPYGYPPHHPPPPPAQTTDPNAPNSENVYHQPPPPPPPMAMYNHYPWPSNMPPPPPGQPGASPSLGSPPEQPTPQAYQAPYMPAPYHYPVGYYPMPTQPVPPPPGGSVGMAQNPPVLYNPNDPTRSGLVSAAASSVRSSPAPANRHAVRTPSGSGNGNANGNKRAAPPPARAAWSYGPGVGIGGFPGNVSGGGETVGPRLAYVRRSSMASSSGSGSTGQRTPASGGGGDEASSTSSSTTSSSSRRTYTSTTSSQHPLPARPDWAVGLKPQTSRHHDHRMSPARNGLNLPSSLSHPPTATNGTTILAPGATPVNLQSTDFPPLSTINSASAPEKKTPVVSGAWTNPASARTIMTSNGATSGSALVPQRMASNGAMPPEVLAGRSINGNGVGRASNDNCNNKANDKEKDKARGEAVASAILVEPMASMTIGTSNGSNLAASDSAATATAPPTLSTVDGGGGGGVQPGAAAVPVA